MIVIDANVAIEVARNTNRGKEFDDLIANADKTIAPTLFLSEVANAIWKYAVFGNPPVEGWQQLFEVAVSEIDEFVPDASLFPEALSEAVKLKHSVYDMLYLVLARRTASPLLTGDRRLVALCEGAGVTCVEAANI